MHVNDLATESINGASANEIFVLPASSIQGRYWLIDRLSPGSPASNSPIVMRLAGVLNRAALERTLNDIVRRHEALRTTFAVEDGVLMQFIAGQLVIALPTTDLSSMRGEQREAETHRLIQEHGSISFDLTTGPLVRCRLIRIAEEEHILAVTTHQIVCDGWSNGILVKEIALTYEAFAAGKPAPFEAPRLQYADFAVWHNEWLAGEQAAEAREFWLRKLNRELLPLDITADRPRRPGKTFPGAVGTLLLPEALVEQLRSYARARSTTLYVALMGAFQILMKCYARQDQFVITTSCAGRSQPGLDDTFGRFAHPQIVLADLEGDPTFEILTGRIQSWCTEAWANQDFPLEKILEAMGTYREDFQALELRAYFVFQKAFMHIHRAGSLTITPMVSVVGAASVDLGFGIVERVEGTRVHVEYNSELFDATTIERLMAHYRTVLQRVVENPRRRVSEYRILTPSEREDLLLHGNQTAACYSKDKCVQELVERQVEATPHAVAAVCGKQQWTFGQLNARANRIAWHLRRLGVEPDDRVGVCLERSLDMPAALLGILKAGAAYVPLETTHPPDRLARIVEEAGASVLLTRTRFPVELAKGGHALETTRIVCLDAGADAAAIEQESASNPPLRTNAANLAYVIFTSGSTGQPKGVRIGHRSFVNFLEAMQGLFLLGASDALVAITTISFDIAGLELFLPLIAGARTVIAAEEHISAPERLRALLAESGATILQATPDTWRILVEDGWQGDGKLKMLCGGDVLSRALADSLMDRGGELWNMYGPTETTIWSSAVRVARGQGSVPLGGVIANTQFYVLNDSLEPVPVGVPGELYIGGDGLAEGYQNLPELSGQKFMRNPFLPAADSRMYRTGDLVKLLSDGKIEFLGRLDDQVKIRGFRIELGEIEATLREHSGVEAAVVVRCKNPQEEDCLAAYVTARRSVAAPRVEELAALLNRKLARPMQPSSITLIEKFPLTTSGKLDRKKLSEMYASRTLTTSGYEPPRDSIQARLVEIWEKVLKIHPIGIRTSFFDLGGYSLTVVRLFAQINKTFDRNLPIATVFSAPTIEKLANAIRGEAVTRPLVPIQPRGAREPLFVVHSYLLYSGLRHVLGEERPLYGLQEIEDDRGRMFRLEDRVEAYVREVRSVQASGPYYLIGWCAAGTLTLEVARALRAGGDDVALLGLIDAARPGHAAEAAAMRDRTGRVARWSTKWDFHRNRLAQLNGRQKADYLRYVIKRGILSPWQNFLLRYWKLIYRQCKRFGIAPPDFMHNVSWLTFASMQEHRILPYDGTITLFRASDIPHSGDPATDEDASLGWQDIAMQKVDVIWVPGDHESMFREPHLDAFGERLKEALSAPTVSEFSAPGAVGNRL